MDHPPLSEKAHIHPHLRAIAASDGSAHLYTFRVWAGHVHILSCRIGSHVKDRGQGSKENQTSLYLSLQPGSKCLFRDLRLLIGHGGWAQVSGDKVLILSVSFHLRSNSSEKKASQVSETRVDCARCFIGS